MLGGLIYGSPDSKMSYSEEPPFPISFHPHPQYSSDITGSQSRIESLLQRIQHFEHPNTLSWGWVTSASSPSYVLGI